MGYAPPRRACERRATAAGWQVAQAAAKFATLWNLDWTLVGFCFVRWKCPAPFASSTCSGAEAAYVERCDDQPPPDPSCCFNCPAGGSC